MKKEILNEAQKEYAIHLLLESGVYYPFEEFMLKTLSIVENTDGAKDDIKNFPYNILVDGQYYDSITYDFYKRIMNIGSEEK